MTLFGHKPLAGSSSFWYFYHGFSSALAASFLLVPPVFGGLPTKLSAGVHAFNLLSASPLPHHCIWPRVLWLQLVALSIRKPLDVQPDQLSNFERRLLLPFPRSDLQLLGS